MFWPLLTLVTLVYLFSAFVLVMGIAEIIHGLLSIRRRGTWWVTLLIGIIGLGVGIYLVRHPDVSLATFIVVVGAALIARGLLELVRTFIDRNTGANRILYAIVGVTAVVAGIVILLQPTTGSVAFVWVLGLYAVIYGALILAVSFDLRQELQALPEADSDNNRAEAGRSSSGGGRRAQARTA
jgi:uncharacterized membrane protein HdeD (DUF308 family)